jgi:hypothetical protein
VAAALVASSGAALWYCNRPFVPITMNVRSATLGEGQVAVLTNTSRSTLWRVKISCESHDLHQAKTFTIAAWESGETYEIGWMEGWVFVPGETVTISCESYRDRTFTVPPLPD